MTELKPVRISSVNIISGLYFHDVTTDIIYQLKNTNQHRKYNYLGLNDELHVDEDDLINKGKLNKIIKENEMTFITPMYSY